MISANGKFYNPDMATLQMISTARRGGDNLTLHLTNQAGFNNLLSLLTSFMAAGTATMKIDLLGTVTY